MAAIVPAISNAKRTGGARRLVDHFPDKKPRKTLRRRWGSIEVLSHGGGHRVERITVKAQSSMPVHSHDIRSEHWTVVSGEAQITLDDDVLIAAVEDSVFIAPGQSHGLEALGDADCQLIAVHFGDTVSDRDDMCAK